MAVVRYHCVDNVGFPQITLETPDVPRIGDCVCIEHTFCLGKVWRVVDVEWKILRSDLDDHSIELSEPVSMDGALPPFDVRMALIYVREEAIRERGFTRA